MIDQLLKPSQAAPADFRAGSAPSRMLDTHSRPRVAQSADIGAVPQGHRPYRASAVRISRGLRSQPASLVPGHEAQCDLPGATVKGPWRRAHNGCRDALGVHGLPGASRWSTDACSASGRSIRSRSGSTNPSLSRRSRRFDLRPEVLFRFSDRRSDPGRLTVPPSGRDHRWKHVRATRLEFEPIEDEWPGVIRRISAFRRARERVGKATPRRLQPRSARELDGEQAQSSARRHALRPRDVRGSEIVPS
jgi:hypothetical protein